MSSVATQYVPTTSEKGGWTALPDVTATGGALLPVAGIELIASIGDKVRYKQGGGFKYGYVAAVGANQIGLFGGSDYSVTPSTAVTELAISHEANPFGFPSYFNITTSGGSTPGNLEWSGITWIYRVFSMQGRLATVQVSAHGLTSGVAQPILYIHLSLGLLSGASILAGGSCSVILSGAAPVTGQMIFEGGLSIGMRKVDNSNWPLAATTGGTVNASFFI